MWAAALHPGPHGLLTGQFALVCDGWNGKPREPMHVIVPADVNPRNREEWFRLHRAAAMPPAARRGIPRARPAAAVIDAARWARTDREAMFIVVSTLQQRLCDADEVLRRLDERPSVARRAVIRDVVTEFIGGATSMGEVDFGRLCRRFGIRQPDRQVPRWAKGRRYLDVYFDAEGVVVEIEGLHHLQPEIWLADQDRQNEVVLDGDRIFLRVATWTVKYEPEPFMEQLQRALRKT